MANITLDYADLGSFFVAQRLPGVKDVVFKAEPTLRMFYMGALTGKNGASEVGSMADAVANPAASFEDRMIGDTLFFEQVIEYITVGGTVNGHGAIPISNTPQDRHQTARWRFSEKSTPIAIASAQWRASLNTPEGNARTGKQVNLIQQSVKGVLKTQVQSLSIDLFSTNTSDSAGLLSLNAGIGQSATDTTTYAGISRSTITQWRGNYTTATSASLTDPLSTSFLYTKWSDQLDVLNDNGVMKEDVAITCGTTIHKAWRKIVANVPGVATTSPVHGGRFQIEKGGGLPTSGLTMDGVPIIRDPRCNTNQSFMIDTSTTIMVGLANSLFDMDDWRISENVTQHFARMTTISQIAVTCPRNNYNMLAS
jgi:hypothetical protein